jgi:hypothetical protein
MSAAPPSIADGATIVEAGGGPGREESILRRGSNEWTCFPDDPATPANDPVCFDKMGLEWRKAWADRRQPELEASGLAYRLRGGASASDTDPFAAKPEPGSAWRTEPPHMMIFPVGKFDEAVYGTDSRSRKPWLKWAGTPWEHLIVPVE